MPAQIDKSVPIVDVRPMAPVGDGQTSGTESSATASRFQRLPPVESSGQDPFFVNGLADNGASYHCH